MNVELVHALYALLALAVFRVLRPALAALAVFLGGWLLLPVGNFPPGAAEVSFPYWITGLAVPSNMLFTKAWAAPAIAMLGVAMFDRATLMQLRWSRVDVPMLLWCLWPLLQALTVSGTRPGPWVASAYLFGSWGLPWMIGRLYCGTQAGQALLLKLLAATAVICLPIALVEGLAGPRVYGWLYEPHPFRFDGATRYVGYRPLGFFENGNQYGLWICLSALAAIWLATQPHRNLRQAFVYRVLAVVLAVMALAAQSVGGLLLLACGLVVLVAVRIARPGWLLFPPLVVLALGGAVYLSGIVPVAQIGKHTVAGQQVIHAFRSLGRGSFTWRIGQDQKLLHTAMARPLAGTGDWDWWREAEIRPWGLALLIVGQFGLIGMLLAFGALLWPAALAAWRAPRGSPWRMEAAFFVSAILIGLTAIDALLNSFLFFPAVVMAGGLANQLSAPSYPNKHRGHLPGR